MLRLDGYELNAEKALAVILKREKVALESDAEKKVQKNREYLEGKLNGEETIYGINTGFGHLSQVSISPSETGQLQKNLLLSHAAGFGPELNEETVRGVLLLRANALSRGNSGVRPKVIHLLLELLNREIHPVIPEKGSVGASGDLAPLAHMSLALIGEGEVNYKGRKVSAGKALKEEGLEPLDLKGKEGLALINGTQVMAAIGLLALWQSRNLLRQADAIASLSWEGLCGLGDAYDPLVHQVRPHPCQQLVARNMCMLVEGSENYNTEREDKVQDAYSLRCIPQVHGASREAVEHLGNILSREINSVTDNPLIFSGSDRVISGGNFHGQPLALPLDYAAMAMAEVGNIAERRVERLVNPALSGLPPFLIEKSGLNSGYMVAQYTAASLVSENKVLAGPASIDSIPTSANQEDHVSMGTIAARKLAQIVENLSGILAVEALCSAQAIDLTGAQRLGRGSGIVYDFIRERIPYLEEDRYLAPEIKKMAEMLKKAKLLEKLEEAGCSLE